MSTAGHDSNRASCVLCAVVTVSDTRTRKTDKGGALVAERLTSAGHRIVEHEIVRDDADVIRNQVERCCSRGCEAIVLTGGTGIAARDNTYEAIVPLIEKRLDGFAELFRMLSFAEIGPLAILSRAVAGTSGKSLLFSIPGSPAAVQLAMDRLILPVLPHAVGLLRT